MSIITKVIIDTKEYHQLKETAAAYKALVDQKQQTEGGVCTCQKEAASTLSLSQIAAENDREHAVSPPQKSIIPSITSPYAEDLETETSQNTASEDYEKLHITPDDRLEFEEAIRKKDCWYYVGPFKDVRE